MSISLCGQTGGNTGGIRCAESPGVAQHWAVWGGKLTPEQLAVAATLKSTLIAHSKLSKSAANKLFLMPAIQNKENRREGNQETTLTNGLKIITREGLPGFRWSFFTSQAQLKELRKFNGYVLPVIICDNKQNTWGAIDGDGNFVGRQATIYFEGLMAGADDNVKGMAYVEIGFIDAQESYDNQYFIKTPFSWQTTFKALIDVQLVQKAAPEAVALVSGTAATATVTVTNVGSDGDTINVFWPGGTSLTAGTVAKTASESTVTLLAAKIKDAINAATGTHGYTATNSAGVITITAPVSAGATLNTVTPTRSIVGGITTTAAAGTGGVTAVTAGTIFKVGLKVDAGQAGVMADLYEEYKDSALGSSHALYNCRNASGVAQTVESVDANDSGEYFEVKVLATTAGDYVLGCDTPTALDAANVVGIEVLPATLTIPA